MAKFINNTSDATWWPNLEPIQVAPPGRQISNFCKWCHLVAKFSNNSSWPNFQQMHVAPPDGQFSNNCKWCHLVAEFPTYTSSASWWPNGGENGVSAECLKLWPFFHVHVDQMQKYCFKKYCSSDLWEIYFKTFLALRDAIEPGLVSESLSH